MHFNTKYIFQSDSQGEIVKKINHNFGQIISFSCGAEGHPGDKGPTGPDGPAGNPGGTGATGSRGTMWFRQFAQPQTSQANTGDLWADSNTFSSDVKILSATGSWNPTGYSLIFSPYLKSYDSVLGVAGVFEKYAIGLNNSGILSEKDTSLVISDNTVSLTDSNPNRSKLVVSTYDQTSRPIFSFVKSNRSITGNPSFYWTNPGSSFGLSLKSSSSFSINSLFSQTFLSKGSTGSSTLVPVESMTFSSSSMGFSQSSTTGGIYFSGTGDFSIYSNTTTGSGTVLSITSSGINLGSSSLNLSNSSSQSIGFEAGSSAGASGSGSYSLRVLKSPVSSSPSSAITSEYPTVLIDSRKNDYALKITQGFPIGATSSSAIFSVSPRRYEVYSSTESITSPFVSQTKFGGVNLSATGGTAGPYFYHVKKVSRYTLNSQTFTGIDYGRKTVSSLVAYDLSSISNWNSDVIVITPGITGGNIGIKIPTTFESSNFDLKKTYRVILNDNASSSSTAQITPYNIGKLTGIGWDSVYNGSPVFYTMIFSGGFVYTGALTIPGRGTHYVDLTFVVLPSGSKRVLYKTSNGCAGFIII